MQHYDCCISTMDSTTHQTRQFYMSSMWKQRLFRYRTSQDMFKNPVNVVNDATMWASVGSRWKIRGPQVSRTNGIQNLMTVQPFMDAKQTSSQHLPQHNPQLHDPIQNQRGTNWTIMLFNDCRFIALNSHYHELSKKFNVHISAMLSPK